MFFYTLILYDKSRIWKKQWEKEFPLRIRNIVPKYMQGFLQALLCCLSSR